MLGQMGQSLFDTVGSGLMQYGNAQMMQPFIKSAINANYSMTGGVSPDDVALAAKHGISY